MLRASVSHDDCVRDALPVVQSERASAAGVLGAVAGGVLGGHPRELPQEAGGVRAKPAEDLGYERDDFLAARESVRVVARPLRHEAQAGVFVEGAVGRQSARGGAVDHDARTAKKSETGGR